jgi:hypothetical protein
MELIVDVLFFRFEIKINVKLLYFLHVPVSSNQMDD